MRWIWVRLHVCLLLAACGSADPAPPVDASLPMPAPAQMSEPITGSHGGNIQRIAVTDDGGAAISSDGTGLRLWPALDGTREPVVVHGAVPRALAIARDGDGFAVADQDGAGGVELIRLAANGAERGRTAVRAEPAIVQIEMTEHGAIVLRADESLERIDARGEVSATLVPEPGARIASIVRRAGRTLVLIDRAGEVRGRWLMTSTAFAWGDETPPLPIDPARPVVLSPDGAWLVGAGPGSGVQHLVEIARGRVKNAVCAGLLEPEVLGFADDDKIACVTTGQLVWWSVAWGEQPPKDKWMVGDTGVLADWRVIAGVGHQLALYGTRGAHYLGYGVRDLSAARIAPAGVMISKGDQQPLLLDDTLHARAQLSLPRPQESWRDVYALDDRYLLTAQVRTMRQDMWSDGFEVAVYDTKLKLVQQVLALTAASGELQYQPATHLLATSDGAKPVLLRFDPLTHTFGPPIAVSAAAPLSRVQLVDPALADGLVAIGARKDDRGTIIEELAEGVQRVGPRATYRIAGEVAQIDSAGHVYARDGQVVTVWRHAVEVARLPGIAQATLYPSPDGLFVAALAAPRVTLASSDGRVLWRSVAWGATELGWLAGDALIARFGQGLAQLDGATGAIADRQCGWAFGIADTPFETSGSAANVCDVAP